MALSQLLGLSSCEASHPPTFTAAGSGGPGGEIVFSKNNVCAHPAEVLPGQTEHCPGYLCVHTEKDEELGTTLILTWVPNSRIQRQDEEALRYVTPEGVTAPPAPEGAEEEPAPLAKAGAGPQQRGEEWRESQGSGLNSTPAPPPVGEALVQRSRSGLPGNIGREMRDESVTHSASGLSQNSPAPSEDGQSQAAGREEQQKVQVLEPRCGVFRVDLGRMRSLRLFFSDEACASGQLVIASRESHFQILHFHHAGLDKLAEVFQQWKCCQETQLKDQVLEGRSCLQFSVLRPCPPAADPHAEDWPHAGLDQASWGRLLNHRGEVEEQELRKAVFFGGVDPAIRRQVWPFLLRCYSAEEQGGPGGPGVRRQEKHGQYQEIQQRRLCMSPEEQGEFWRKVQFTVDRDVVRTDCSCPFFRGEDNPNVEIMRRILLNFAVWNPGVGYCQGMSDLVAPLLLEVQDEADAFWCFVGLMENSGFISPHEEGMEKQLAYLRELLGVMEPGFHQHLARLGEDGLLFCHRWLLLGFRREFPHTEVLLMWEACWARYQTDYFHLFLCVAIIALYGDGVAEKQLEVDQMLLHFSGLAMHMNGELVLRKARSLLHQFSLHPTVPYSLRSLCKRGGPGTRDSGPAAERGGERSEPQNCPGTQSSATLLTRVSPQPALPSEDPGASDAQHLP